MKADNRSRPSTMPAASPRRGASESLTEGYAKKVQQSQVPTLEAPKVDASPTAGPASAQQVNATVASIDTALSTNELAFHVADQLVLEKKNLQKSLREGKAPGGDAAHLSAETRQVVTRRLKFEIPKTLEFSRRGLGLSEGMTAKIVQEKKCLEDLLRACR